MGEEDAPPAGEDGPHERQEKRRDAKVRRYLSLIGEATKATLAILMVLTTCTIIFIGRIIEGSSGSDNTLRMPSEWWTLVGLVIGFYFGQSKVGLIQEKR